jgi:hypothetical protein
VSEAFPNSGASAHFPPYTKVQWITAAAVCKVVAPAAVPIASLTRRVNARAGVNENRRQPGESSMKFPLLAALLLLGVPLSLAAQGTSRWNFVAPGKFGIAVISPPLDNAGNSVRAQKAISEIVARLNANPYAVKPS